MMDLRAGRGTKVLLNVFETKKATYIRLGRLTGLGATLGFATGC